MGGAAAEQEASTSPVEWLELFFDLVVVAAVAVLTDGLREDPTWLGLELFLVLYAGIWFSWVTVVLYANVAGDATRTRTVVVAMFLVAVMAATAPIHFEHRANAFVIAFLALRIVTSQSALRTGRILATWPLLQFGGATFPWVISLWVDTPWKYALWALGLALDLLIVLRRGGRVGSGDLDRVKKRLEHDRHSEHRHDEGREASPPVEVALVDIETEHLQERLGLFLIIVLGEVVSLLVLTASTRPWTGGFTSTVVPSFVVLVGLWWLTFSNGFVGAPHTRMALLPPRFGLPMHLVSTIGIVAMAAGFGQMASYPEEHLGTELRWIMCVGLALHFAMMAVSGAAAGAPRRWVWGWAIPCVLAPLLIAPFGEQFTNKRTVWVFVLCIVWMAVYGRDAERGRGRQQASATPA